MGGYIAASHWVVWQGANRRGVRLTRVQADVNMQGRRFAPCHEEWQSLNSRRYWRICIISSSPVFSSYHPTLIGESRCRRHLEVTESSYAEGFRVPGCWSVIVIVHHSCGFIWVRLWSMQRGPASTSESCERVWAACEICGYCLTNLHLLGCTDRDGCILSQWQLDRRCICRMFPSTARL